VFRLEQLPPVLRREMSRLHPGDVTGPFYEPALGWHLVRLEEVLPARRVEPAELQQFLEGR
jgi:parvulin-like peptidyl-prolyl isomerase